MARRHLMTPRGSGPLKRRFPRQCVIISNMPIAGFLRGIRNNQAVIEASQPLVVGAKVEFHHAEAGMISAQVVDSVGKRTSLAFSLGSQAALFALNRLKIAVRR